MVTVKGNSGLQGIRKHMVLQWFLLRSIKIFWKGGAMKVIYKIRLDISDIEIRLADMSRFLKSFLLTALLLCTSADADPLANAVDLGNGEYESEWFGQYNKAHYPWIYHRDHGWMYAHAMPGESLWLWMPGIGWACAESGTFPVLHEEHRGWVYLDPTSGMTKSFYDYSTDEWIVDQGDISSPYFPIPKPHETYVWRYQINEGRTVSAVVEGDLINFDFKKVQYTFRGHDMIYESLMEADLWGAFYDSGIRYDFTGDFSFLTEDRYHHNTLGLYFDEQYLAMDMLIHVAGVSTRVFGTMQVHYMDEALVNFLSRDDLYAYPVGTTFNQAIEDISIQSDVTQYINGSYYDGETDSMVFSNNSSIEILEKLPNYYLKGRTYHNVIRLRATNMVNQVMGDPSLDAVMHVWVAPGIGMIRSVEEGTEFNEPLEMVLTYCSLW
jgi:hypothetical protein